METTIKVDNLKCGGCAATIEEALLEMKGVDAVKVLVQDDQIVLTHDVNIDLAAIKAELKNLGYPEHGTTHGLEKLGANAKSYVSCAVGRIHKHNKAEK